MSTHNMGFYEDLTKIIFELSSNTHLISSAVPTRPQLKTCFMEDLQTNILKYYHQISTFKATAPLSESFNNH